MVRFFGPHTTLFLSLMISQCVSVKSVMKGVTIKTNHSHTVNKKAEKVVEVCCDLIMVNYS